ncbi:MAG: hypothetical protein Q9161_000269 [Pseudevernia consocians]
MTPLLWVLARLKILLILLGNLLDTQIDISAMLGLLEALRVDGTPPTLLNALSKSEKPIAIQSNEPKLKESMKELLRMFPGNSNGPITHKIYYDKILEALVKKWIERGDDFCLEEDGALGHDGGPKARSDSLVAKWKDKKKIDHGFNCHDSPDLASIENMFQGPKGHMRKHPHWDEQSLMDILPEGWDQVSQEWINKLVESMPKRLQDVIRLKGGMTGH